METRQVAVPLPGRAYDIHIGSGLLLEAGARTAEALDLAERRRVAVITDETVARLHLDALTAGFREAGFEVDALVVSPGERSKSWETLGPILERLLALKIERKDALVAFGGGVVGDLAGFAAAILRRGVRFVQIPTTLLAQVDSSVGGKTGINAAAGKNLIGAFHQPSLVLADLDLLESLPPRELKAGYAEVLKYGLLGDAPFFEWLERRGADVLAGDRAARAEAVAVSCAAKAAIVLRDETEQGDRALLNLGHTFGHALEAATGYSDRLLHGEGVAIGMALAFELSRRLGHCSGQELGRVKAHLEAMGLVSKLADIEGPLPDADGLLALMAQDKKAEAGRLTFILARGVGQAFRTREAPLEVVRAVLRDGLAARGAV
ncbi:MAG: 3-dehydroquinate synthase, partial [Pseudomonadota bacterium]